MLQYISFRLAYPQEIFRDYGFLSSLLSDEDSFSSSLETAKPCGAGSSRKGD